MTAAPLTETPTQAPAVVAPARPSRPADTAIWGVGLIVGLPVTVEVSRAFTTIVLSLLLGH